MNLTQHTELWSKVGKFTFDEKGATLTFSHKLSQQQDWSATFTARVIEEYRRFIFLCCISPTGASPSKAVDEAWHLHLTYTKSYWIDFCKNTLGKDIHHNPSKGSDEENHKHEEWYKETLALYETVFGSLPPGDIWPPPQRGYTGLPEPKPKVRSSIVMAIVALLLIPFITSYFVYETFSPFSLTGPQFLRFYFFMMVMGLIAFYVYYKERARIIEEIVLHYFPTDVSVFQAAKFFYGKHRATQTGIVDLVRKKLLELTGDKKFIVHKNRFQLKPNEKNPLVPIFLYEEDGKEVGYDAIADWYYDHKFSHPALDHLEELAKKDESFLAKYLVILPVFLIGVLRLMQGLSNGHPVGFLTLGMIFYLPAVRFARYFFTRRRMIAREAKKIYQQESILQLPLHDAVVSEFAFTGNSKIYGFDQGVVLASLFTMHTYNGGVFYNPPVDWGNVWASPRKNTGSSNSGSCSSGGCSGGGCGGGGCGGCGGCGS